MAKISFIGDLICQPAFMKAAASRRFDFRPAFAYLKTALSSSDFVVANLETPIAGKEMGYTKKMYSFNTPESFLDALRELPINLYTTANNHCLDRGVRGLQRTIDALDERGMAHTGTFKDSKTSRFKVFDIAGTKCAMLACNASINRESLQRSRKEYEDYLINQMVDPFLYAKSSEPSIPFFRLRCMVGHVLTPHVAMVVKHALGMRQRASSDTVKGDIVYGRSLDKMKVIIQEAKREADLVFLLSHCGGQYNTEPGSFSKAIYLNLMRQGVDAIVGAHPHVIQKIESIEGKPCAYSLGNVSISPSSINLVPETLPEYGMILHVYVGNGHIKKVTFSLMKVVEDAAHYPVVYPIDPCADYAKQLFDLKTQAEVRALLMRIRGVKPVDMTLQGEYMM